MRIVTIAAALAGVLASAPLVSAATIDSTSTPSHSAWRPLFYPVVSSIGQTFAAQGAELSTFSMFLRGFGSEASLDVRGYVGSWDGEKVSEVLYESPIRHLGDVNVVKEFAFAPRIPVTAGAAYVAFLSVSGLPPVADASYEMPAVDAGDDPVPNGTVVLILNDFDRAAWTTKPWITEYGDVFFKADFDAAVGVVPLPASAPLFGAGLVALGGIGYGFRRARGVATG